MIAFNVSSPANYIVTKISFYIFLIVTISVHSFNNKLFHEYLQLPFQSVYTLYASLRLEMSNKHC